MKRTKNRLWLRLAIPLMLAMFLTACGGSGGDGPKIPNYKVLEAVPADGTKTLQAGTADTHEVETDGTWIVWKGRTINMGYYNGSSVSDLNLGIPLSTTPWAFGDCEDSPIAYDGTTLVFVANDVADAAPPKFFYLKPGQAAKSIEIEFEFEYYYDGVYVHGSYAAVYDSSESAIYVAKLTDAKPQFEMIELEGTPADTEPVGLYLPVNNGGQLELIDISDPTNVITLSDGASYSYLRSANKTLAWVSNGSVYYWKEGMDDSALVYEGGSPSYPLPGPNYMLWMAGGKMYYLPQSGYGAEASPTQLAFSGDYTYDLEAGNGFFAYIDYDDDYNDQIYVYNLSDPTAPAGVPVTLNGDGAGEEDDSSGLVVDGTKVYGVFEYRDIHNPSRVLVMYDHADGTLMDLTGDRDFQQVPAFRAANGKAVFLHRDHSFRLFAKRAATKGAFTTLTPASMTVHKFSVTNGVVAFTALDRLRYLDEEPTLMDTYSGDELGEVYYIRMSAPGNIHKVTDNYYEENNPQTDGTFITWHENYGTYWSWYDNVYAYNIVSGTGPTLIQEKHDALQYNYNSLGKVSVDKGIAVWRYRDYGSSLYRIYYDDLTDDAPPEEIYSASQIHKCPDIANGLIVWTDSSTGFAYYYDLNAAEPSAVEIESLYSTERPATDGRYITWEEYRSNWDHDGDVETPSIYTYMIMVYDTVTEEFIEVAPVDISEIDDTCRPRISDGLVVFAADAYGEENPDGDREIFYYDLNAASPEVVRLTNDPEDGGLWDSKPEVSGRLIVWRTGGSRNWDWDGKTPAAARIP